MSQNSQKLQLKVILTFSDTGNQKRIISKKAPKVKFVDEMLQCIDYFIVDSKEDIKKTNQKEFLKKEFEHLYCNLNNDLQTKTHFKSVRIFVQIFDF